MQGVKQAAVIKVFSCRHQSVQLRIPGTAALTVPEFAAARNTQLSTLMTAACFTPCIVAGGRVL
jgi:hypothetical protein